MSDERTVLVTGATDGIGHETARELGRRGFSLLVHGRSMAKAEAATEALGRAVPALRATPVAADFASLADVRRMGTGLAQTHPRLYALVNNAGVFMHARTLTVDGHETTFAVNHLAPFLLTHLLLPSLRAAGHARVVTVSSMAHSRARLPLDDLDGARTWSGYGAYAQSKLANVMFAFELAARLEGTGVTSNALHPGVITTKLLKSGFGMGGEPLPRGAATSVYLVSDPAVAEVTGRYFDDRRVAPHNQLADDEELRRRLWDESARLVGI